MGKGQILKQLLFVPGATIRKKGKGNPCPKSTLYAMCREGARHAVCSANPMPNHEQPVFFGLDTRLRRNGFLFFRKMA